MKNSSIQWTDHTFNAWEGCAKVAPECKNCYAEVLVDHRFGRVKWGKGQPRRRTSKSLWRQPLEWNQTLICEKCGELVPIGTMHLGRGHKLRRQRVFCLSLGDWLDEEVPIEWLAELLIQIIKTRNLNWQLLTKRPQNWPDRIKEAYEFIMCKNLGVEAFFILRRWLEGKPPENVWIGVSAGADQRAALDIPAKIHFLSCEPMLQPIDRNFLPTQEFDWIIFGGESGRNARACDIEWMREGLEFCRQNNITPFVKQLGAKPYSERVYTPSDSKEPERVTIWLHFKDSHGGDWNEWPENLRVREFPDEA